MDKSKLAACGIDCNACAQYKVTMYQDLDAAQSLVEWFRSQKWIAENEGAEAVMKKSPLCKGCWDVTDDCFWSCGCGKRDFRVCCTEKQINHCGECDSLPCEEYKEWVGWHEDHEKAMEYLVSLRTSCGQ